MDVGSVKIFLRNKLCIWCPWALRIHSGQAVMNLTDSMSEKLMLALAEEIKIDILIRQFPLKPATYTLSISDVCSWNYLNKRPLTWLKLQLLHWWTLEISSEVVSKSQKRHVWRNQFGMVQIIFQLFEFEQFQSSFFSQVYSNHDHKL